MRELKLTLKNFISERKVAKLLELNLSYIRKIRMANTMPAVSNIDRIKHYDVTRLIAWLNSF